MKKFNKDKLIGVATYGFWVVYAGIISATIYGTIYVFRSIKSTKKQGEEILKILRGH